MSKTLGKLAAAVTIYACFAVYLFWPYFKHLSKMQLLLPVSLVLAAAGCFVLSRRWVGSFGGSFFAGAIFGFGPFIIGLARFHPAAPLLASTIPWLFCPAAYWPRGNRKPKKRAAHRAFDLSDLRNAALAAIPFLAIVLFFELSVYRRLFPVPTQVRLHLTDLAGLVFPLAAARNGSAFVGFYHIPLAALIMGFSMLLAAKRYRVLILMAAGLILSFCGSVFCVSPIMWMAIPFTCCAVIIGAGTDGLILAGKADKQWILTIAVILALLAGGAALIAVSGFGGNAEYARVLMYSAKMYLLGAAAIGILYLLSLLKKPKFHPPLRWAVLAIVMAMDIFLGARILIDRIM